MQIIALDDDAESNNSDVTHTAEPDDIEIARRADRASFSSLAPVPVPRSGAASTPARAYVLYTLST
jgi:hypothetical protein